MPCCNGGDRVFHLLRKQADFHLVLYYEEVVMKLLNQKAIRVYECEE